MEKENAQKSQGLKEIFSFDKQCRLVFLSTLFCGLAAHGYMFFNKFCWHDDMGSLFSAGSTYTSGRWFLGVLSEAMGRWMGNVSLPWFNGLLSLLFLAAGNMLLAKLFCLKKNVNCVLFGAVMAVFPSLVSTYAYMFTAAYFSFAVLLAYLGIFLVRMIKKPWQGILLGAVSLCLSLGIYQAYLPIASAVFVISFANDVIMEPEKSFWGRFKEGVYGALAMLLGILLYFLLNHITLFVKHLSMTEYQGLDKMGQTNLKMLAGGICAAWKEFLRPAQGGIADMYMMSVRKAYYVALVLTICLLAYHMIQCWKKNRASLFFLSASALCFPIAVNLLYVMVNHGTIHGVMLYAKVMVFVFPIVLAQRLEAEIWESKRPEVLPQLPNNLHLRGTDHANIKKLAAGLVAILLVYVSIFYVHFANVCYLQADFQQKEAISWMTTLTTQIKSLEGYREDLSIAYVNSEGEASAIPAQTTNLMGSFGVEINPYNGIFSRWKTALWRWCGFFHPEITDTAELEKLREVQEMPAYPSAGSIRIIEETIVVKF